MHFQIEYEWLIIAFVHEIVEDIPESEEFICQIENAPQSDNNLVFLIKDRVVKKVLLPNGRPGLSFVLTLSRLEKLPDGRYRFRKMEDTPIYNPDKHCWETALGYVFENFRARRRMLITLSHGAGLGINSDTGTVFRPGVREVLANPFYFLDRQDIGALTGPSFSGMDKEVREDIVGGIIRKDVAGEACKSLEILWISEIRDALARMLGHEALDVLLMVNCYMQLFDTGFMLRKNVRYLISPEGSILAPGYNYTSLFTSLNDYSITSKAIAHGIVRQYRKDREDEGDVFTSLFANSLESYPLLVAVLRDFLQLLMPAMNVLFPVLETIRNEKCAYVSIARDNASGQTQNLIDLGQWLRFVAAACTTIPQLSGLSARFDQLLETVIEESAVGKGYTDHDAQVDPKFGYSGISVYYPLTGDPGGHPAVAWCAYFDEKVRNEFVSASGWDLFLKSYYAQLRVRGR